MASDPLVSLVERVALALCQRNGYGERAVPLWIGAADCAVRATLAALADPYTAITLLDRVGVTSRTPPHEALAALAKLAEATS